MVGWCEVARLPWESRFGRDGCSGGGGVQRGLEDGGGKGRA